MILMQSLITFSVFGLGNNLVHKCVQYGSNHSKYVNQARDVSLWDKQINVWLIIQHYIIQNGLSYMSLFVMCLFIEASLWLL